MGLVDRLKNVPGLDWAQVVSFFEGTPMMEPEEVRNIVSGVFYTVVEELSGVLGVNKEDLPLTYFVEWDSKSFVLLFALSGRYLSSEPPALIILKEDYSSDILSLYRDLEGGDEEKAVERYLKNLVRKVGRALFRAVARDTQVVPMDTLEKVFPPLVRWYIEDKVLGEVPPQCIYMDYVEKHEGDCHWEDLDLAVILLGEIIDSMGYTYYPWVSLGAECHSTYGLLVAWGNKIVKKIRLPIYREQLVKELLDLAKIRRDWR